MSEISASTKLSTYKNIDANATGVLIRTGETRVYGFIFYNVNAAVRYVKLYDLSTAPTVGTTTPALTIAVPPTGSVVFSSVHGIYFTNGLGIGSVTGVADSDTTAPTSNQTNVNVIYG